MSDASPNPDSFSMQPAPDASNKVMAPAILLIITGALNILLSLYVLGNGMFVIVAPEAFEEMMAAQNPQFQNMPPEERQMMKIIVTAVMIGWGAISLVVALVLIVGGFRMKSLTGRGLAMFASVLAMIPCISCCCPLGLVAGIWSLTVLNEAGVKAAFS